MNNIDIAKLLRQIAASYIIKDEKKFRFQIIAYQRAADVVEATSEELKDLQKEGKLTTVPGLGPSIAGHIEELLKTGRVKHFAWVTKGIPPALFPLLDVSGVGPKKAYKLVAEFKLKNPDTVIDDIEKIAKRGKIATLDGFGEKSQSDILRAITEFRGGKGKTTRMVLPYAFEVAEKMLSYLRKSRFVARADALGSLRRMKDTIGDVDIAVGTDNPKEVLEYFVASPGVGRIIEKGPTSASLLTSSGKQIDLLTVPVGSYGSLLQHFTGSKNHNIKLREYALKKGMSLSERGIKRKKGKREIMETFATEEAFYKALGMDWIPPEMREDRGEIEFALRPIRNSQGKQAQGLPRLVELKDIKGDLHIHSNYPIEPSHDLGKNTMEEMLKKAKSLDYAYLAFSEHNPSVSKHSKNQIYEIMAKRKEKIEQLKSSNKNIRIINLLELDILSNGALAIDDKALSYVDGAIVSVHSSFAMDKKAMTKRVLGALSHPKTKILGHPTGRLLTQRPGYELNFEEVFDFCAKHKKALEINAWPYRLDLPDALVGEAVKKGVKMVIDTDSHAAHQMDMMRFGVAVARRGWATADDIVNTWDFTKLAEWFSIEI